VAAERVLRGRPPSRGRRLARVGAPFLDVQDALFTPDPPERHQTQLGYPIGTPPYLPPEAGQCPAEPRLDVYSLGATLYQLCTQLLPKDTDGRPIREVCPGSDAPDDLSRLLQAALAPDPNERLATADHLQRGLEAILAAHPRAQGARQLFGGSYDRLEVLGVGASAVVFRASDRRLSREVAVKVLRDAEPSEDDAIRFRRAAKVLSALREAEGHVLSALPLSRLAGGAASARPASARGLRGNRSSRSHCQAGAGSLRSARPGTQRCHPGREPDTLSSSILSFGNPEQSRYLCRRAPMRSSALIFVSAGCTNRCDSGTPWECR
jgi:hypothetical protein